MPLEAGNLSIHSLIKTSSLTGSTYLTSGSESRSAWRCIRRWFCYDDEIFERISSAINSAWHDMWISPLITTFPVNVSPFVTFAFLFASNYFSRKQKLCCAHSILESSARASKVLSKCLHLSVALSPITVNSNTIILWPPSLGKEGRSRLLERNHYHFITT